MFSEYGTRTLGARSSVLSRATSRDSPLRRLDWVLLAAVLALTVIGTLLVWSATRTQLLEAGRDPRAYLDKQLINTGLALVAGAAVALFDYRLLRAYAPIIYAVACLGLVAVLTPLGKTVNGSHSWIVIGPLNFQPAEMAKVGLVVGMAMMLAEVRDGEVRPRAIDVVQALALAAVFMALIALQPDLGTLLVFCAVLLGMLLVSGARLWWVTGLIAGGLVTVVLAWQLNMLDPYQIDRLQAFLNPEENPRGIGYNARQARIAVGSGGLLGKGLFQGQQTNGQFVPEQHTDFIFTVAGEELGFAGGAIIIVLLGVVLWRGLRIAARSEEMYGKLLATGVVCWLGFQSFQNIGMTLGIMPITGLPLPFVSYGGTAAIANFLAIGILQNVHLARQSERIAGH